ncbi:MAG: ferredoxin-thioredoxin reductase catalytic chain [Methanosarcinales archaeon]|nr:MAG: Ferredoxin thioredoxin reductase beta chain [Euryarchaeota archaeon 55_53]KUK29793.1 MAG: Ferredoxin thioredoxin reductase beta chain [Methanosarcinales archeaon 56_1174]MDI3488381.1 ferredoxin-thioredoxin reductase catalytic chain [Methanosarcinales archaeon]
MKGFLRMDLHIATRCSCMEEDDALLELEKTLTNEEKKTLRFVRAYANKRGFLLQPDLEVLRTVIKGMTENRLRFGKPYCPCRLRTGNEEEDRKIVCPCVYHEEEIERDGQCHCMLYLKG